ncbi:3-deoxy-7-phosphoheptulonate synthase [Streptomyces sp. PTY087I2]|uniref:3-deoxy-7-phosphoheptulonate synthase n=1 Tax=Streptomyces sp. PTY087I2 TaxID=1819298 RepID=UPI00080B5899|nr:3-deoxy-7-phosphoheptulonate synthase [Streptomyces sp. PTY087I2]OCC10604.1 Phospho-2-dehydro-3-deoxyheptonate aldolase [Streptomyces sp. PTY087I2]
MTGSLPCAPAVPPAAGPQAPPARQQPHWHDGPALSSSLAALGRSLPLVLPSECALLKSRLAAVARGEAFLVQGGDCAESLDALDAGSIRRTVATLGRVADVLGRALELPAVTVGRLAGQYAKPRSSTTEIRDGVELPVYRGDAVNGHAFTAADRAPDPGRLVRVRDASAATLNLVRALIASEDGTSRETLPRELFTSHEGLVLDYERALTRADPAGGRYASSGHLLWIGERTRQLDGAHVEYFAGISNPIAVKIGPTAGTDELIRLVDRLDPDRDPGRLTLIVRMGADRIRDVLPDLISKTIAEGMTVGWVSDPMHGNTFGAPCGRKTRRFDDILDEAAGFFEVAHGLGVHPGGVHLELTGDDVAECVGGADGGVGFGDLPGGYRSVCDPRLNRRQSLDLADRLAALLARSPSPADGGEGASGRAAVS